MSDSLVDNIIEITNNLYPAMQDYLITTPLLQSPLAHDLLIKPENLQITGSFKIRGASSKLLHLYQNGVKQIITASTGNHGLAVATIAEKLGMSLRLFVPESINVTKEEKLQQFDVELIKVPGDSEQAEIKARSESEETSIPFVSPYNDEYVIAGQASIAVELLQQWDMNEIDKIYITIGGGGLISGIGTYIKTKYPNIQIIGCQPTNSAAMYQSIQAGEVVDIEHKPTLSDGSAGGMELDTITFGIAKQFIDEFRLINEDEIRNAVKLIYSHHQMIIEGAAGVALAGFLKDKNQDSSSNGASGVKKSIVVLCGGNIDLNQWVEIVNN